MPTIFHKPLAKTDGQFPRRALTFAAATACLVSTFIAAAIAIPMMAVWRTDLGLTESETAMTVVSYFAGCVLTLFFFARLSNFFGRKPKWNALPGRDPPAAPKAVPAHQKPPFRRMDWTPPA